MRKGQQGKAKKERDLSLWGDMWAKEIGGTTERILYPGVTGGGVENEATRDGGGTRSEKTNITRENASDGMVPH